MTDQEYVKSIVKILETLEVKKVYYIDDELEPATAPTQEKIVTALLRPISGELQPAIKEIIPHTFLEQPGNIRRRSLNSHFGALGADEQSEVFIKIGGILGIESGVVLNDQAIFLNKLFKGNTISLECLSPTDWESKRKDIIELSTPTSRSLCLFDEKLKPGDFGLGSSAASGMEIIRGVLNNTPNIYCVLYSSDVHLDTELTYWSSKVSEIGLESSQFFPLSKERKDTKLFAEGIKISSMNSLYDELRTSTMAVLNAAAADAKKELNGIHLYDLNTMVGVSSRGEGVWEASTLIRLHEILRGDNIKKQQVEHNYVSIFNKTIKKVTLIDSLFEAELIVPEDVDRYRLQPYQLRHRELYENGKYLNATHSELKTGDIFRDDDNQRDFVLLVQPCDIIVRTESGKRKSAIATLASITVYTEADYSTHSERNKDYGKTIFKLDNYDENNSTVGCVEFNKTLAVDAHVLDLAVLSKHGECLIDFETEPECPQELFQAWEKRFKEIIKKFRSIHKQMENINALCDKLVDENDSKDLIISLIPNPYKTLTTSNIEDIEPKFTFSGTSLNYKLRRVTSVRPPLSNYLLDAYTKHLSRTAYEHDFSASA